MIQARNFTVSYEDPELAKTWSDNFTPALCTAIITPLKRLRF
jgi:hypothetical protein